MSYLASDKVTVFPSTERANGDGDSNIYTYARMMSEGNLTNLISSLISPSSYTYVDENEDPQAIPFDGFIISTTNESGLGEVQFILKGYYFKADMTSYSPAGTDKQIWATIQISNFGALSDYPELSGKDEDNEFKGLTISNSSTTGSGYYNLLLYVKDGNSWKINENSYIMKKARQIDFSDITKIDGQFPENS